MFVLAGATTGLWIASTGLVKLDRGFVLELAGWCSFCGSQRSDVRGLVGCAGCAERICDNCLELCREIIREELGEDKPSNAVQPSLSAEEFQRDVADVLESVATSFPDEAQLAKLRRALAPAKHSPNRVAVDIHRCTFCGAERKDVVKLIAGPRVFICDVCVYEATAVVAHVTACDRRTA
jgi:hypothetical protein